MLHFRQAILQTDRNTYQLRPGQANSFAELYVDFQQEEAGPGGERYTIFIHPKQNLTVRRLEVQFDLQLGPAARFFANGYQSWSESRFYAPGEAIPGLRSLARRRIGFSGDEHIGDIPRGPGYLHSWTYTTIHDAARCRLLGSLNESTGFTLFLYDQPNAVLTVRKDLAGLQLEHSFPALDFWAAEGVENQLFDAYFALLRQAYQAPAGWDKRLENLSQGVLGWTSWYHYFTDISEKMLLDNLAGISDSGLPFRWFQIDDGWQTAVGDWLSVKKSFPAGMARLAGEIRARGLTPGLWLAPFVASARSELARKNPDWLLTGHRGRPLRAGWNPHWGGWYFALNFYHPKVQDYLSGVFHVVLEKWGFGLLKLDFLFAAALAPPPGKTRGQVMAEALEWLRRQLGDREMLACGVPLGPAFGWADYCRIGGDVHLAWEHRLLAWLRFRERPSTLTSLRATLNRWPLGGRAFGNDPDVFILRKENQKLTPAQQHTLLTINALLGNALFTSDDVGRYSPEQTTRLQTALDLTQSRVTAVCEIASNLYQIDFLQENLHQTAFCNLSAHPRSVGKIQLQPFETIIPQNLPQP